MVQKYAAKRGRPRGYDPDTALAQAMAAFWDAGYATTTLEAICAGTGMNRPSLYTAFGDKRELYGRALDRYRDMTRTAVTQALAPDKPLREGLRGFYDRALSLYLSGEHGARGCFLIGTALTESVLDTDARVALCETLREIDAALEARIRLAQQGGELAGDADPRALAVLASAALHSLAIRSRAGEQRDMLQTIIEAAVDQICGRRKARSRAA